MSEHRCVNCGETFPEDQMFYNESSTMILPDKGWLCKDADPCVARMETSGFVPGMGDSDD